MAVFFANTANTTWYSNTNTGTFVTATIPSANIGDTLLMLGYTDHPSIGLIGTQTGFPTFNQFSTFGGTANGALFMGYRIVDGTEGSTAYMKLNGAGTANLSIVTMRIQGAQRILPVLGAGASHANSASDGVSVSTGSGTPVLFHEGGMTISLIGSNSPSVTFDNANTPSGFSLATARQSNNWIGVAFRENPTEITNHGTIAWAQPLQGGKRSAAMYILPDVPWAGVKGNTGSTSTTANTLTHRLFNNDRTAYKAKVSEEIYQFGVRVGTNVGGGSERVQIGLYDITSGTANASLVANAIFSTLSASQFNTISITPVALVANSKYAIGIRSNTTSSLTLYASYVTTPYAKTSSLVGSDPLQTWNFDSGTNDNRYTAWAEVRTITEPTPVLTDVDGDEAVIAGQQNVTANGSSLSNVAYFSISSNTTRSVFCNIDSNTSSTLVIDIPSMESLIASNIKFGNVTYRANTATDLGLGISGTLSPNSAYKIHNVTDISQASKTGCIYYGLSPAIEVGDQILYSNTSSLGYEVSIDSQGYPSINSSLDITDYFNYRIYENSDLSWGAEGVLVSLGATNPSAVTRAFRVVKSLDGKRYSRYSGGNAPNFLEYFNSYSDIAAAIAGDWDSEDVVNGGSHSITLFQGSKRYTSTWTQNESRTLLYYRFPGAVNGEVSTGKSYVKLQWEEYRDANWDFQADKSCRMVGRLADQNVTLDVLLGMEGSGTPGNSTRAVVFGQGLGTGSNFAIDNDWNMNREQWYKIAVEIQLNSIGNSDGWIKLWRDDILRASANNINIRGGVNNYTFHQVAIGGWESGGAPASSENRYIDNVEIWYS
jgi:hypothetical protein